MGSEYIQTKIKIQSPMLVFPRNFRKAAPLSSISHPRTQKCKRATFYHALRQFNAPPDEIKYCHLKLIKRLLEKRKRKEVPIDENQQDQRSQKLTPREPKGNK